MAKFMAIYTGQPGATPPDAATVAKGGQAWGEWMARNAGRIVESGGPLGKTKKVSSAGIADTRNNIAAYVIVEADDHEAAARLFEGHPHFAIFPGDGVEVMPVMPIPTF
jgi:phosphoketolase